MITNRVYVDVDLTADELITSREVGVGRATIAPSTMMEGTKTGKHKHNDMETTGVASEIAVGKYFGVEPDLKLYPNRNFDTPPPDLMLGDYVVNVKSTTYFNNPHMLIRDRKLREDVYVMTSVSMKNAFVRIWGYMWDDDVRQYTFGPWKNARLRHCYAVPVAHLRDIRELIA